MRKVHPAIVESNSQVKLNEFSSKDPVQSSEKPSSTSNAKVSPLHRESTSVSVKLISPVLQSREVTVVSQAPSQEAGTISSSPLPFPFPGPVPSSPPQPAAIARGRQRRSPDSCARIVFGAMEVSLLRNLQSGTSATIVGNGGSTSDDAKSALGGTGSQARG
jgi:hypothetical protein